jgi:ATP/ADP translocase
MFQNYLSEIYAPASVLSFIVLMGALQNVIGRGTKYSLYDSTKEMLYIPLSNEMKAKGKAAADIIGTKVGKSIGAIIQSRFTTKIQ